MVYSLPVLIFCFINVFNSTWADACNSLSPTHQGNDENFNNRNIFRSIFFEHALRREPRMVNVCERVGTERLVNNRRIVDSDSRITNFPARDGTNARIQNSRIVMERREPNIREQGRENIRERFNIKTENNPRTIDNRRSTRAGREILINRQSRSTDPSADFQRRNIRERVVRDARQERNSRVTRNDIRSRNVENSRTLDASRERDLNIRLDQTVRKDSFERSRRVTSLPEMSRNNEDSIRVVRDSSNNNRISRDSVRQDRTVRISRDRVSRQEASLVRMARDSRTNEKIPRDLSRQDRTVRISGDRVGRIANDVKSRSVEDRRTVIRVACDFQTNDRISREDRTLRISRERVSRNANNVRSRSLEDQETNERISRALSRQDRTVRISREREGRNTRNLEDQEAEIRMVRNARNNERISKDLIRQDRAVRISRERENRNANSFRSRSVEDVRSQASIRDRDSRNNERISRDLIRQDRTVRVSRERNSNNQPSIRVRDSRSDERISRDFNLQDRRVQVSRERIVNDARFRSQENENRNIERVRDSRNNERISRDLTRQDRLVRVSRDRNTNNMRSRSLEEVRRVRSDPEVSIRMARDSRNNARVFRNVIRQERTDRVSRERLSRNVRIQNIDSDTLNRAIRDTRDEIRNDRSIRLSRNIRSRSMENLRNTLDDARRTSNLETSRRTVRESRENPRLARSERTARISRELEDRDTRIVSRSVENLHRTIRSIQNQNLDIDRRVNSQIRMERDARFSREYSRHFQPLNRDSRIRSVRNIRDELPFVGITKISPTFRIRDVREENIREITSQIDSDSRRNVPTQQVGRISQRRFDYPNILQSGPQEKLAMRSINARFSIKDENNNDVDENSNRSLLLNGQLSAWSNALTTILGIIFVAHVLSTSSSTKKSPAKYFSSLFSYQKEKVL